MRFDDYGRECQMPGEPAAYHPYAACLMFKQCRDSETVLANLRAVLQSAQHRKALAVGILGLQKRGVIRANGLEEVSDKLA